MKIVSLNVWHGAQVVELRQFLTDQIASTDVFCFQEADGESIEALLRELLPPAQFQEIVAVKPTPEHPDCLRTFVRHGVAVARHYTVLDDVMDQLGLCIVTELVDNGVHVAVAQVHGAPSPGDKLDTPWRIEQSRAIIDRLRTFEGAKIVCGDFNLLPETESVALFERSSYANLITQFGVTSTRNRLAWQRYPDHIQYFADYAFASPGTAVAQFAVPDVEASDHLPLIITCH